MKDKEGHTRICFHVTNEELKMLKDVIPHSYRQHVYHALTKKLIEEFEGGNRAIAVDIVRGDIKLEMLSGERRNRSDDSA